MLSCDDINIYCGKWEGVRVYVCVCVGVGAVAEWYNGNIEKFVCCCRSACVEGFSEICFKRIVVWESGDRERTPALR